MVKKVDEKFDKTSKKQKIKDAKNIVAKFMSKDNYFVLIGTMDDKCMTTWSSMKDLDEETLHQVFLGYIIELKKRSKNWKTVK